MWLDFMGLNQDKEHQHILGEAKIGIWRWFNQGVVGFHRSGLVGADGSWEVYSFSVFFLSCGFGTTNQGTYPQQPWNICHSRPEEHLCSFSSVHWTNMTINIHWDHVSHTAILNMTIEKWGFPKWFAQRCAFEYCIRFLPSSHIDAANNVLPFTHPLLQSA